MRTNRRPKTQPGDVLNPNSIATPAAQLSDASNLSPDSSEGVESQAQGRPRGRFDKNHLVWTVHVLLEMKDEDGLGYFGCIRNV